ncbi:MAG TPA: MASE1 domain-containing protein, partial [Caulobacteraceae bacterium]|nr:MASE1 domain-containing protein [Caulobacteraceae bacterium]
MHWKARTLRRLGGAIALWAGFCASVTISVLLARPSGTSAALWTANGFLAGAIIVLRGRWRLATVAACLAAQLGIMFVVGDPPLQPFVYAALNLVESALAAGLALKLCGLRARRLSVLRLMRLLVMAVVPAAVLGGLASAVVNAVLFARDFGATWRDWTLAGGLGMSVVLPAVVLLSRGGQYPEFRRSWLEIAGLLGATAGVAAMTFLQSHL